MLKFLKYKPSKTVVSGPERADAMGQAWSECVGRAEPDLFITAIHSVVNKTLFFFVRLVRKRDLVCVFSNELLFEEMFDYKFALTRFKDTLVVF